MGLHGTCCADMPRPCGRGHSGASHSPAPWEGLSFFPLPPYPVGVSRCSRSSCLASSHPALHGANSSPLLLAAACSRACRRAEVRPPAPARLPLQPPSGLRKARLRPASRGRDPPARGRRLRARAGDDQPARKAGARRRLLSACLAVSCHGGAGHSGPGPPSPAGGSGGGRSPPGAGHVIYIYIYIYIYI